MGNPIWLQVAEAVQNLLTAVGIVVAGIWTYQHFIYRREHETALQIDLSGTSEPYGHDTWLTFLDVCVTNKGRVKLAARKKQSPAYRDKHKNDTLGQEFNYGLDLQLWSVPTGYSAGDWIDWSDAVPQKPGLGWHREINLATGYYEVERDSKSLLTKVTDFWMEPGESYSLGVPVILAKGCYLAKVTFIGEAEDDSEFWQRLFLVCVPNASDVSAVINQPKVATGRNGSQEAAGRAGPSNT